ncbi:MAG TPA: CRISPR-associated helicase Cas3', partial [bacterium]|nr:CRISPR-associated helicase Cas3' [bacterium]
MIKLSNSFKLKTFKEFANFKFQISDNYFAHISNNKKPEKLNEHIQLVLKYFFSIIEAHQLEYLIDNAIKSIKINNENYISEKTANIIKQIFFEAIFFHDSGKINENFQCEKMKNKFFKKENNNLGTEHSTLSAFLFWHHSIEKLNNINSSDNFICSYFLFLMCLSINRHHSPYLSNFNEEKKFPDDNDCLKKYLQTINIINYYKNLNKIFNEPKLIQSLPDETGFILFFLTKLNYSLLTACDYYATFNYMNSINNEILIRDFGILSDELKDKMYNNFYFKKEYNKNLKDKTEFNNFNNLSEKSLKNLNLLRENLAIEIKNNIKENYNNNLFYIEAPTGSGKTNLAFLCIAELLQKRKELKKIFYVLPFTTLITQTFTSMLNTFDLSQNEIIDFHSKTGLHIKNSENYESLKFDYIDYLFLNYPITLLSHITFFDILKSNSKETNYILHRLANSIVIIDEIQSYNPNQWDKVNLFLQVYSEFLNIVFIVMSATLPKIDKILLNLNGNYQLNRNFVSLVSDKTKYFNNPNFKERINFDFSFLNQNIDLKNLVEIVFEKSEEYYKKNNSVNTLIEFIIKKTAGDFYKEARNLFINNGYDIFVLSGTILEPRRKEVIYQLNKFKNKKILLISTQVIEAGVDIDFDIGFKDMSILDSEEQFAGRINRNAVKNDSIVYFFKFDKENLIYCSDLRLKEINNLDDIKEILSSKNFDKFYLKVIERINYLNSRVSSINIIDYINEIKNNNFKNINSGFKLISEETIPIFVPINIKIKPFPDLIHFSDFELNFIKRFNKNCVEYISGKDVWDIFEEILSTDKNKNNFFDYNIDMKTLQGLMAKFTFSIFKYSKLIN